MFSQHLSFQLVSRLQHLLLACCLALPAMPGFATAPARQKVDLPPSTELKFAVKARISGLALEGDAQVRWQLGPGQYTLLNEWRSNLAGKIYSARSEGGVDEYGLAPSAFTEKRLRKNPTSLSFDRAARMIRFGPEQEAPLRGGEQDRTSAVWQLIGLARAAPAKFNPGREIDLLVAGRRDVDAWQFRVEHHAPLNTAFGEIKAVHLVREPAADAQDQKLDVWLAPSLGWLPVRLRFAEDNGDQVEHLLQQIVKQ